MRAASHWWTYRSTKARRELGWRARPHEETLEATVAWHLEREHDRIARTRRSQQIQYRLAGAAISARRRARLAVAPQAAAARSRANLAGMAILYRCKAPTDLVCRCGKVARRLREAGIDFEQVRVPIRRRDRERSRS